MKVRYFWACSGDELEKEINYFCKRHEVVQISYSTANSYSRTYECMVLYKE